jgi:hypothetical protein
MTAPPARQSGQSSGASVYETLALTPSSDNCAAMHRGHLGMTSSASACPTATAPAEIVREYGPFPVAGRVNGVTYDGEQVWPVRASNVAA